MSTEILLGTVIYRGSSRMPLSASEDKQHSLIRAERHRYMQSATVILQVSQANHLCPPQLLKTAKSTACTWASPQHPVYSLCQERVGCNKAMKCLSGHISQKCTSPMRY